MTTQSANQTAIEFTQIAVTRPTRQAQSLVTTLSQALSKHHSAPTVQSIPLLTIGQLDFKLHTSLPFNGIIFISSNAVTQFFQNQTALEVMQNCPSPMQLLAVGDNTATCIRSNLVKLSLSQQFNVSFPTQMNAEGLLSMPILANIKQQQWLLVKGRGGRELIENTLKQRAAQLTTIDVYERVASQNKNQIITALSQSTLWLVTSAAALEHLQATVHSQGLTCDKVALVISSDRLHSYAQQLGFKIVAQSKGASESQLIQCIQSLF
jgi:uroporphyrinogen-III synthase